MSGDIKQYVGYGNNGAEVTAVANTGYRFVEWSDGVKTSTRTDNSINDNTLYLKKIK